VLYCIVLAQVSVELALRESRVGLKSLNPLPARFFCSSRSGSYIETRGPTGGPEVVGSLHDRALLARSSK
jgi:hypothetical protein